MDLGDVVESLFFAPTDRAELHCTTGSIRNTGAFDCDQSH